MRQLTNDPERDRGPAWAADGKWTPTSGRRRFILSPDERTIYHFETRREGDLRLMRVGS